MRPDFVHECEWIDASRMSAGAGAHEDSRPRPPRALFRRAARGSRRAGRLRRNRGRARIAVGALSEVMMIGTLCLQQTSKSCSSACFAGLTMRFTAYGATIVRGFFAAMFLERISICRSQVSRSSCGRAIEPQGTRR